MCLILFAYQAHPRYKLILAANRDEFYDRPAAQLAWWEGKQEVLAGKDLKGGGTWMGVNRKGEIAALTNYREPHNIKPNAPSRGDLVVDFLTNAQDPASYLSAVHKMGQAYNGYNLLVGDLDSLYYHSNRAGTPRKLDPGIYGLSNHILDTPWPKIRTGKEQVRSLLASPSNVDSWFYMLQSRQFAPDRQLPDTGISLEWERMLSAMYIEGKAYGTRVSSLILVDQKNNIYFEERAFVPAADSMVYQFDAAPTETGRLRVT